MQPSQEPAEASRPALSPGGSVTVQGTWHQQPVVWLGALVLVATLAGCLWLITLATRHADEPLATAQPILFRMPTAQPPAADPAQPTRPGSPR